MPSNGRTLLQTATVVILVTSRLLVAEAQQPVVSVGKGSGAPGERAVVPVRVSGTTSPVRQLTLKVQFPEEFLRFVEARPVFQQKKLTVQATAEPAQGGMVTLAVQAESLEASLQGDVLELVFEISKEIYTDQEVAIKNLEAAVAGGGKPKLEDGSVKVSVAAVVFGCFFYMH